MNSKKYKNFCKWFQELEDKKKKEIISILFLIEQSMVESYKKDLFIELLNAIDDEYHRTKDSNRS